MSGVSSNRTSTDLEIYVSALNIPLENVFQGALITEDRILDNMPPSAEEFEQYLQEITKKADDRTKRIMMRICDELANLQAETSKEAE